jgi:hypothetical protein
MSEAWREFTSYRQTSEADLFGSRFAAKRILLKKKDLTQTVRQAGYGFLALQVYDLTS